MFRERLMKPDTQDIPSSSDQPKSGQFQIQIDRASFQVDLPQMTGSQLRELQSPPISPHFDLFEVMPSGSDRKIHPDQVVEIRTGLRFFTAPTHITAGRLTIQE